MKPVDIPGGAGSCRGLTGDRQTGRIMIRRLWAWSLVVWMMTQTSGYAFDAGSNMLNELRAGVAAHDVDGLWSGDSKEAGPDLRLEAVFSHRWFDLLSGTARPHAGATFNTRGDTSSVFAGILLRWDVKGPFFLATGLGLAVHDGERDTDREDKKALGSRMLFRIPIEVGVVIGLHHTLAVTFDHMSNAYLFSPNDGLDTVGLLYGYRF